MPANALAPEPKNAMLRPYDPTLRERIAAYFMGDTRPSPERRQFATGIADILSYLPGTGNVIQGEEAYRRGDTKGAMLAALPVPGAANVAARAEQEAAKRAVNVAKYASFDNPTVSWGSGHPDYQTKVIQPAKDMLNSDYAQDVTTAKGFNLKFIHDTHAGREESRVLAFDKNGNFVGSLQYTMPILGEQPINPQVSVRKEFRRKGVATEMYKAAKDLGGEIPPYSQYGQVRTDEGEAFRKYLSDLGLFND